MTTIETIERNARKQGLSIAEANDLLQKYNQMGRISELGGYRRNHHLDYYEGCWFCYRKRLVNARNFGIIRIAFDILFDREPDSSPMDYGSVRVSPLGNFSAYEISGGNYEN